jgi:hypothetical protein
MSRKHMKRPLSCVLAVRRSVEKRMVRMRRPWAVSNPVRSTTAAAPPSGVWMSGPADASRILVPPNSTCSLSCCTLTALVASGTSGLPPEHWPPDLQNSWQNNYLCIGPPIETVLSAVVFGSMIADGALEMAIIGTDPQNKARKLLTVTT